MANEGFDPGADYESVDELPIDAQANYAQYHNGFVRKEAMWPIWKARMRGILNPGKHAPNTDPVESSVRETIDELRTEAEKINSEKNGTQTPNHNDRLAA